MASQARNVFGAFEKRAPAPVPIYAPRLVLKHRFGIFFFMAFIAVYSYNFAGPPGSHQ